MWAAHPPSLACTAPVKGLWGQSSALLPLPVASPGSPPGQEGTGQLAGGQCSPTPLGWPQCPGGAAQPRAERDGAVLAGRRGGTRGEQESDSG